MSVALFSAGGRQYSWGLANLPYPRDLMLYIVQFEDKPNMGELRDKLLQSHFDFLDRVKDRVTVPGRESPKVEEFDVDGGFRGRLLAALDHRAPSDDRYFCSRAQ